jgi:uncharacterized Zn-binding protein involved in type VI secretion
MGKPAARLGDMTAHGGTITGPGCPMVLIGGMPAATMGDMHVCPMVTPGTPPIPHVGGPITLGSMGVLIGGKPAARMGDMAVCVGPPSSIILGCMTVLIGEAGGGGGGGGAGAGGGGGGGTGTAGALQSAAIAGQTPQTEETEGHYLDMSFVDSANLPVGGIRYVMSCPDNTTIAGFLGNCLKRTGVPEGDYTVTLMAITNLQWSPSKAEVGDKIKLTIDTIGLLDGSPVLFTIIERKNNHTDKIIKQLKAQLRSDHAEVDWVFEYSISGDDVPEEGGFKKFSSPDYFFEATVQGLKERSGVLKLTDYIEIKLVDEKNKPVPDAEYKLYLSTGEVRSGKLDSNGYKKEMNIPPGKWDVSFPNVKSTSESY